MSDLAGLQDDASLPHEQLEARLRNLFDVPSRNIESAFSLILGLIKEQSTEIEGLKRARAEALEHNDKARASLQSAVDVLAKEKAELSVDLQTLKAEHHALLQAYDKTTHTVDALRQEVETLSFNFLGESGEDPPERTGHAAAADGAAAEPASTDTESSVADAVVDKEGQEKITTSPDCSSLEISTRGDVGEETVSPGEPSFVAGKADSNADEGAKGSRLGWGIVGRIGVAKAKAAKVKLSADRTVVARLDRLEQSLSSLIETRTAAQTLESAPTDGTLEGLSSRIDAVEAFLHGFSQDGGPSDESQRDTVESPREDAFDDIPAVGSSRADTCAAEAQPISGGDVSGGDTNSAPSLPENNSDLDRSESASAHSQVERLDSASVTEELGRLGSAGDSSFVRRGSLLFHLSEREAKTGLSIDDLARQISSLRESLQQEHQTGSPQQDIDPEEARKLVAEVSDGLQKQVAELATSVDSKVSRDELEAKIQELCSSLDTHPSPAEPAAASAISSEEFTSVKRQLLEQVRGLEATMVDKDFLSQQLDLVESHLKSLLEQELGRQQLALSASAEKSENDLKEIRSVVEAQNDAMLNLRGDSSVNDDDVNQRIQQATDALRVSLEARLDELRAVESEIDVLTSELEERPSQLQLDAMISDLEKRLGQDDALRDVLANIKTELEQRMTHGEVISLVQQKLRDVKLGIQSAKDGLMIGRTAYCLGCSTAFPAGVNGARAPLVHDSLRPATGLLSNRRSIRPLQALRSAPHRPRPKSAIVGRFSPASAYLDVRNSSR